MHRNLHTKDVIICDGGAAGNAALLAVQQAGAVPMPWVKGWDAEDDRVYYHNTESGGISYSAEQICSAEALAAAPAFPEPWIKMFVGQTPIL